MAAPDAQCVFFYIIFQSGQAQILRQPSMAMLCGHCVSWRRLIPLGGVFHFRIPRGGDTHWASESIGAAAFFFVLEGSTMLHMQPNKRAAADPDVLQLVKLIDMIMKTRLEKLLRQFQQGVLNVKHFKSHPLKLTKGAELLGNLMDVVRAFGRTDSPTKCLIKMTSQQISTGVKQLYTLYRDRVERGVNGGMDGIFS